VYMGTNYQGLYRSTDGGASWSKINTGSGGGMLDQGRIWSLALDPFNANTLYAASGYGAGGPLKSTDGGISWTHTLPATNGVMRQVGSNDIYNVAVDPYTPNHLLVSFHSYWYGAQDSGLLESFDGGANWTIRNPPPGGGWGAGNTIWFLNNSQTWLLGSQSAGLWRTTNAGQSWTKVSGSNIAHGGIYSLYRNATTGVLYVAVWNGILTSTDNGATWRPFIAGLPYAAFDAVFGDGTNLYTAPGFPVGGDNGQAHGPWYTAPESGGTGWRAYNSQQPCYNGVCNGPVQMAMDRDGSIYSVNWDAGIFKLPRSGAPAPSPAATATSVGATPAPATATPTPTRAPAQPAFTSSASASPQGVARGTSVAMTVSVNSTTATNTLIDLEVYDGAGVKVFQQWWDGQSFAAGQTRTYSTTWSVPGSARTGTYTLKIGVFAPGWGTLYHWNNNAATFSVT
jgi:hypothetical protein